MSNYPIRLRTLLHFTVLSSCLLQSVSAAGNVTVHDTDPSIAYLPSEAWYTSMDLCATCLNPGLATTFHEGIHEPVGPDTDDGTSSSALPAISTPAPVNTPPVPIPAPPPSVTPTVSVAPAEQTSDKGKNNGGGSRRSLMRRVVAPQPPADTDDTGDPDVRISFNFTGSAVYLFGILPPAIMNVNSTSPNMNLTFLLDNVEVGTNKDHASSDPTVFSPGYSVFSVSGLTEGPHELLVKVGQNSTFIFQSLMYTTAANATSGGPSMTLARSSPTSPIAQNVPSATIDPKTKKHNIATFGGAVGGSVGVLALFSLGLAISIIRRRKLGERRDRLDRESLHTNASDDSPMSGPAPFVPRYFPDTVIPPDPPTYMAALATNHNSSALLATLSAGAFRAARRSYADIPPTTPPPPMEEPASILSHPPPPFVIALTNQPRGVLATLQEGALPPSIPGVERSNAHTTVPSVGTVLSDSPIEPERVPLLQAVDNTTTAQVSPISHLRMETIPSTISSSEGSDLPE